jgi:Fe-S-cluster containining protein
MIPTYTCDHCGLCCRHLLVESGAVDILREPQIDIERPLGKRAASLSLMDACWILAGPGMPCPFFNADNQCAIYPTRPDTCVAFMAGSAKCQELRADHGVPRLVPRPAPATIVAAIQAAALAEESQPT